ncbi:unnamed protein product [Sphenostylis stenocarpa]|uniref:Uncharacterized protein n=1 Tax=Sphenostylis stenocarpa TaxID=92480 RepID=A0AA86T5A2_9FABA|nr:unnamed protein product [Sphenostylis stenocarpa]
MWIDYIIKGSKDDSSKYLCKCKLDACWGLMFEYFLDRHHPFHSTLTIGMDFTQKIKAGIKNGFFPTSAELAFVEHAMMALEQIAERDPSPRLSRSTFSRASCHPSFVALKYQEISFLCLSFAELHHKEQWIRPSFCFLFG